MVLPSAQIKDEEGHVALFQELASKPTTVTATNINLFYGALPGNKNTSADVEQAYVQATLKAKHRTFIKMPRELWPDEWHKAGYQNPVCLLVQALYGHPEAGAHWERHLTAVIKDLGGKPVPSHPSTFWFPDDRLMLTVYVDDLLLGGPSDKHEDFWRRLQERVKLDPPEPISRFLGRYHDFGKVYAPDVAIREYFEPEVKA